MNRRVAGILAALGSPFVLTIGFIIWDKVWKGHPLALNCIKCTVGTIFFVITFLSIEGDEWIYEAKEITIFMLLLSAFIGIIVGDSLWLEALKVIGARRVILIDIFKPFCATLFGWLILNEGFHIFTILGVVITTVGVLVVSLERTSPDSLDETDESADRSISIQDDFEEKFQRSPATSVCEITVNADDGKQGDNASMVPQTLWIRGHLCAVINVVFDVYGSVLTKQHAASLSTWDINSIRFGSSAALLCLIFSSMHLYRAFRIHIQKSEADVFQAFKIPNLCFNDWIKIVLGISLVTYLAPALSQYALFRIDLAVALTLGSVGPIYSLPLVWLLKGERVSKRAAIGSVVGCLGIIPLYFNDANLGM